jgi:hypothetical protein
MRYDMEKKITVDEGFQAMTKFLEKWYEFTKSDDIAFILSGMGMDPAFRQDWINSVEATVVKSAEEKRPDCK